MPCRARAAASLTVLAIAALAAGCSGDAFNFPWQDTATAPEREAADPATRDGGMTREQAIRTCLRSARAQVDRDRRVDRTVYESSTTGTAAGATAVQQRIDQSGYQRRLDELTARCMRRKGFDPDRETGESSDGS